MNKLANVVYAYSPKNEDELELKVGDKIEVIGTEEEGWWKGKLRGRVGVFPSNFVTVVETNLPITQTLFANNKLSKSCSLISNNSNISSNNNNFIMNNTQHQDSGLASSEDPTVNSSERRPKPIRGVGYGDIFPTGIKPKPLPADTIGTSQKQIPKKQPPPAPVDISSNGDQAPALPPKPVNQFRTLPQREQARVIYAYEPRNDDELEMKVGDIIDILDKEIEDVGWWKGQLRGKVGVFPDNFVQLIETPSQAQVKSIFNKEPDTSSFLPLKRNDIAPTKLNHITANRAKGPSRRPPSNILNKKNQFDGRKETNGQVDPSLASLPVNPTTQLSSHDSLSSLPTATASITEAIANPVSLKSSSSLDNVDEVPPKTSQRLTQQPSVDKTPPWMVELKKAHAGRKRDSPLVSNSSLDDEAQSTKTVETPVSAPTSTIVTTSEPPTIESKPNVQALRGTYNLTTPNSGGVKSLSSRYSGEFNTNTTTELPRNSFGNSVINNQEPVIDTKNLVCEMNELKEEVKRLQKEVQDISELKSAVEVMKVELKACQSATESQRRYIKDLVSNLADERKKIAAMQDEIDRNLK